MKRQKGFTLIEVIIAMAIFGVMSTIAIFSYQNYVTNNRLRTAARGLEADLFSIKQKAVSERVYYRITLNVGANNYTIDRGGGAAADAYTVTQTKSPTTLGSGVSLLDTNFASARVVFQPRGTPGSGTGRIRLTNGINSIATITVNSTGRTYAEFAMQ
jgi:prepilin-type N-terminal cleavage/methylation domain-containing protein